MEDSDIFSGLRRAERAAASIRPCGSSPIGERQSYEAITLSHTANVVVEFRAFSYFIDTELFTQLSVRGFVVETATPLHHLQIVQMVPSTRR